MDYEIENTHNLSKNEAKNEENLSIALCAFIAFSSVTLCINAISEAIFGSSFIYDTVFCYIIYAYLLGKGIFVVFKRMTLSIFISVCVMLCFISLTALLFPNNQSIIIEELPKIFIYLLPAYLLVRCLRNSEVFLKYFRITCLMIIISSVFAYLTYSFFLHYDETDTYMSFSYSMLIGVIGVLYFAINYRKVLEAILSFIGILTILLTGARGPMVCIFSFVILYIIINFKIKNVNITVFVLLLSIIFILIRENQTKIFETLSYSLDSLGIHSRTIMYFEQQRLFDNSGRDMLYNIAINSIPRIPLCGLGLFGDRILVTAALGGDLKISRYIHNIILEIILQFGIVLGPIIICFLIYFIFKRLFSTYNLKDRTLLAMFFSVSAIKLLFSNSYLEEPYFYIMIAFALNMKKLNELTKESLLS